MDLVMDLTPRKTPTTTEMAILEDAIEEVVDVEEHIQDRTRVLTPIQGLTKAMAMVLILLESDLKMRALCLVIRVIPGTSVTKMPMESMVTTQDVLEETMIIITETLID